MSLPSVPERVAAGVAWLDENVGRDWPSKVRLGGLAMASGCRCVLGYVFRDAAAEYEDGFNYATEKYGRRKLWAERLGFDSTDWDGRDYPALNREWKRVIAERQASR